MTHTTRALSMTVVGLSALGGFLTPRSVIAQTSVEKLQEFSLDQVQITDKYQVDLFAKDIAYINSTIDADRLMNGFKAMSTGSNPTNLYGGWENSLIRGHTIGHWLSAMARAYQQTKGNDEALNTKLKAKLDHVMSTLKTYQLPNGFLFATPVDQFGAPEGQNVSSWVPWYTMHKILAGIVDVAVYEENADAAAIASKLGDWIYARANAWDSGTRSRVLGMEYGGMNDALYELYKLTKKAEHLTAAHIFDETNLFTTTAAGTDTLSGKHANTTIPKFIGALNRYRTLGTAEQSYFTAADQFLNIVLKNHTYVTGGNSQDEHFHASGKLDPYRDNVNNETCNVYNMSKLTRDLFRVTGDVKYADYYERVHINEILASINPETGMTTYFKAMGTGYFKVFGSETNHFWCCTGTGMENFTRLNDSVYFHDAKDLWVTYYVSSTLNWKDRGLSLTQSTDLPASNKVSITVNTAPTDTVNVKFRKPYWASTCQVGITINGQAVTATEAGGFFSVSRIWKANDKVELTFPLFVQSSRLQDNQNAVAFTYGPLVLSAGLGTASMTTTSHGVQVLKATKPTSGIQDTISINSSTNINAWLANLQSNLVQTPGKLEFTLKNTDSDSKLVFTPHYTRYKDRYGIYFNLSGTTGAAATPTLVCPPVGDGSGGSGGSGGAGGSPNTTNGGSSASGGSAARGGSSTAGRNSTAGGATPLGAGGGTTPGSSGNSAGGGSTAATNTLPNGTGGGSAAGGNSSSSGSQSAGDNASAGSSSTGARVSDSSSGCSCHVGATASSTTGAWGLLLGLGLFFARGRSRRRGSAAN
jgi:uncharacterized protein